jgi:nucleoside-diphosphate-sugar epimerase
MKRRRILVTGARGYFGPWVVDELRSHGYDVVAADAAAVPNGASMGVEHLAFRLSDHRRLTAAVEGCSGVVHLAAYPSPKGRRAELVFRNNTGATVSVLEAAARAAVAVAVIASSTSAVGLTYAPRALSPHYVPIDEDHPLNLLDAYALSKAVDEKVGRSLHDRSGMAVLALRFHWIAPPGAASDRAHELAADPAAAARELWGYVDARDAARATRLALERPDAGFTVLNIVAADTLASTPTAELVARYHPSAEVRCGLSGFASAWSFSRARRTIGYTPEHSWREAAGVTKGTR